MTIRITLRWLLGTALVAGVCTGPFLYYRAAYAHAKRLREVTPGKFYRCGQLTQNGLRQAIAVHGIRTVINLQNEDPDPKMWTSFHRKDVVLESELCRQFGVRYVYIGPDLLPRNQLGHRRPTAIDEYLRLLDDPSVYPVLLHCKAGLHRTGLLTAVYRMEYDGWSKDAVLRELKANGFGDGPASTANDYIVQYIQGYQPGLRCPIEQ